MVTAVRLAVPTALVLLLISPSVSSGGDKSTKAVKSKPATRGHDVDKRILSAAELTKYMQPYVTPVQRCYVRHAVKQKTSTGEVRLELIIHRNGNIHHLGVVAAGVRGKKLARCIAKAAKDWHFPPRRGFTTAVVPFFFLQTNVKGAGPLLSCWNPKGCPKQKRSRRSAKKKNQKKGQTR